MKTTIYLIRHSKQLKINIPKENSQIANEKIILSILGEEKAKQLSIFLKNNYNIDYLYSSNYVRAISTAKYISDIFNIDINIDSNFGERKLGDLNSLEKLAIGKKNSYSIDQILNENFKNIGSESMLDVRKRALLSLNKILKNHSGKNICIVTHGALIKFLLLNYCNLNKENMTIEFNGKKIVGMKLDSPDIIKLEFNNLDIETIEHIPCL